MKEEEEEEERMFLSYRIITCQNFFGSTLQLHNVLFDMM
jgi:hypothetical protein